MLFRVIPNKREYLARAFGRLGVLRLLEQTIARRRPGLVVLTYHRIAKPGADLFYDPVISATPESFRAQVEWLHNRVRLLTLDELIDQVESGSPWREPAMLLTFDDGYRDNFDLAVPILNERKAPATFFVPSGILESPRLPWWDHIACVIKQTPARRLIVERHSQGGPLPLEIDLQPMSRRAAIMKIIRAFLDETIVDERWFLDRLAENAMVEIDSEGLGRQLVGLAVIVERGQIAMAVRMRADRQAAVGVGQLPYVRPAHKELAAQALGVNLDHRTFR